MAPAMRSSTTRAGTWTSLKLTRITQQNGSMDTRPRYATGCCPIRRLYSTKKSKIHTSLTINLSLNLFQTSYKMSGMHPSDWDNLVGRFDKDDDLFQEFYRNYVKRVAKIAKCTGNCKGGLLCEMVRARTGDNSKCHFSSR